MSIIIHPHHIQQAKRGQTPENPGKIVFWTGTAVVTFVALVSYILIGLCNTGEQKRNTLPPHRATDADKARDIPLTPNVLLPVQSPLISQSGLVVASRQPSVMPAQEQAIRAVQIEHMRQKSVRNEFLLPEDRSPLAPTPAMIQSLQEERGNLQ